MGRFSSKLEQLKFAYDCFRRGNDARFMRRVKDLDKESNLVSIENYGNENSDGPLYFIDMEESHSGFFAEYNKLLAFLYFADQYHLKPVVKFHERFCYAEKHPVNGADNPFEYYFRQPCGISPKEMMRYSHVLKSRKENSNLAIALNESSGGYARSEAYLNEMAKISAKYIRLNDIVREEIQKGMEGLGIKEENTLAVHVRGTDFKNHYNGHPVQVTIDEYLQEAVGIFQKGSYDYVFLATDDTDAIETFQKEIVDKAVFYQDVVRSDGNDTVMHSSQPRENHHYLLGLEVLRDMHTLANCGGLIAGLSQVSYAARIQKKSVGKEYTDLCILNKGINYHQKENCPV
ncbi:MAG: O-fucosyltransferase family protein [Lachnospiraceae bacterium]|nr:O-fucosyltransferase family protein [Lachnospiraceae bacterium]